jgi:hypothetical protein
MITTSAITLAGVLGVVGLSSGTASAASPAPAGMQVTSATPHSRSNDGQPCSDWTNEDGTHGTNCPAPSGSGGTRLPRGSYIVM